MHQHRPETTDFTMPEENPDTSAVQRLVPVFFNLCLE